jgi:hypothetical protein
LTGLKEFARSVEARRAMVGTLIGAFYFVLQERKFYMVEKTLKAFCWATGLVQVDEATPEGALELASGPESVLKETLMAECRYSYAGDPLVPGIPEATDGNSAVDAASEFSRRLQKCISRKLATYGGHHDTAPCL